ncbi:hypothetical protein HX049_17080 [Myroides odoratimimus]|uniref:DUF5712 family protein n=1 Tax=Myroides odoratimimus TaxID=76832 RepID=UPI0025749406|nr:DUF5712 family protein [Myroides odoratimimus]MDM1398858.1 hypothetical protein [Myroides odoratimimus]
MYGQFNSHNAKFTSSCGKLIEYLSKENEGKGHFFTSDYTLENNKHYEFEKVVNDIDNNRGARSKNDANYYVLTISPSEKELIHMKQIAKEELKVRGLDESVVSKDPRAMEYYKEQLDQTIDYFLKSYTQDMMKVYAKSFNEQIYVDQDNLPNKRELVNLNNIVNKQIESIKEERGYNEDLLKVDYDKKPFYGEDKAIYENTFKVDNVKEKDSFYEFEYKGVKLFTSKDISRIEDNNLTINSQRLEHYYNEAKALEQARTKPLDIGKYMPEIIEFKYKGKDVKLYEIDYETKNFGTIKLKFNEENISVVDTKITVPTHMFNHAVNKQVNELTEQLLKSEKQIINAEVWKLNGFNPEKRELTDKDLMYYATIENERTYKRTNSHDLKSIDFNLNVQKEVNQARAEGKESLATTLESQYIRDKKTNEIIFEGVQKGGENKHVHVVISRHDKTNKLANHKISLSPMTNHREQAGVVNRGFERKEFFKDMEQGYDKKFEYERSQENSFEHYNSHKNYSKEKQNEIVGQAEGYLKGKIQQKLKEHLGIEEVKKQLSPKQHLQEINPIAQVRKEMKGMPLPTKLPKGKIDLAIKVVKALVQSASNSIEY